MQAIKTVFHGPGSVRGPRIHASCEAGAVIVSYDHGLNLDENHRAACEALIRKLGWKDIGGMVGGNFKGDYYWVFISPTSLVARVSP